MFPQKTVADVRLQCHEILVIDEKKEAILVTR